MSEKVAAPPLLQEYFASLRQGLDEAYAIAQEARSKGFDPEDDVEIKPAADVAARVESIVGPKNVGSVIRQLEAEGKSRDIISHEVVCRIMKAEFCEGTPEKLIDQAVRTGVSIITEGVLVAPTEGIARLRLRKNPDGSDYLAVYFAGPIRSAGGTAAALAVVLADVARKEAGVGDYRPTDTEVERYVEEINLYHTRGARLQYHPSDDDIRHIIRHCPVCIEGDPTEEIEVSVYRDLERMETNRVRGGIALVACEGIAQKAAKVYKYTGRIGLDWSWLEAVMKVKRKEGKVEIRKDMTFLRDLVAGRPIFSYPMEPGGFRLRYGRARNTGIMAKGVHPATMVLLDDFPALGTQMKLERPGKGCVVAGCDSIDGPIVKLASGAVRQINSIEEAEKIRKEVVELLFLGDILVTVGDFIKSNHPLIPAGYCHEWWELEAMESGLIPKSAAGSAGSLTPGSAGVPGAAGGAGARWKKESEITAADAIKWAREKQIPLHPKFTYFWHDLTPVQLKELAEWLASGELKREWFKFADFKLEASPAKRWLELLGVPHEVDKAFVVINAEHSLALLTSLGLLRQDNKLSLERFNAHWQAQAGQDAGKSEGQAGSGLPGAGPAGKDVMQLVNELAGFTIKRKAPIYIGSRMGRPEKAKERPMRPPVHSLFPLGHMNKDRSVFKAYQQMRENPKREGSGLMVQVARLRCPLCKSVGTRRHCACGGKRVLEKRCSKCNRVLTGSGSGSRGSPGSQDDSDCECGGQATYSEERAVNLVELVEETRERCAGYLPTHLKGVKGMISKSKIPEALDKGFLRAKHNVYVFRDGTIRFDATDMPLTHFTPAEIGTSVERLRELGYQMDCLGKKLERPDQVVELFPQDILLAESGADYMLRTTQFIDDLLIYLYSRRPFYKLKQKEDLVGQLVVGLSPHTSAGVLGRIIGFTSARVGYAHPYFHMAKRRNCFHGQESLLVFAGEKETTLTLEDLYNSINAQAEGDAFGSEIKKVAGMKTVSFNPKTREFETKPISHVSKHPAPEHLVKLRTASGREILATGDHPFPDLENGLKKCGASRIGKLLCLQNGSAIEEEVVEKHFVNYSGYVYSLTVEDNHTAVVSGIAAYNCDGDEDSIILLMDALLNFSRHFLPESRGGTMDAPLVLTTLLNPNEIDDEVHAMETCPSYPLELYRKAEELASPTEVPLPLVKDTLGTEKQYYQLNYTHPVSSINSGPKITSYVTFESMKDKVDAELALSERIRAVEAADVARRVILSHFLPDLYGNLRNFSRQTFRCVDCNRKYRRVPLKGKCTCGGKLILTTHKGGVLKYLGISQDLVRRYHLPNYLSQRLELLERDIASVFEDDKSKQFNLADFM